MWNHALHGVEKTCFSSRSHPLNLLTCKSKVDNRKDLIYLWNSLPQDVLSDDHCLDGSKMGIRQIHGIGEGWLMAIRHDSQAHLWVWKQQGSEFLLSGCLLMAVEEGSYFVALFSWVRLVGPAV